MNDRFLSMQLFTRVARTGSFSAAGREMGLSQPSASRIVAALETRVGVPLLRRTTRGVKLTDAGNEYLDRTEAILAAVQEADHAARGDGAFRGILRIACSATFAMRSLLPSLPKFADMHPELKFELLVSDHRHDVIAEGVDVAFRMGGPINPDGVARKIGSNQRILVAAPCYLARSGTPRTPKDLMNHCLIIGPAGQGVEGWTLRRSAESITMPAVGRYVIDGTEVATFAAVKGMGIVSTAQLACADELRQGTLVRVLPKWEMDAVDINLFFPAGRKAKPSARAFADFIGVEFTPPNTKA